jgi:antirestriction protein ArdC
MSDLYQTITDRLVAMLENGAGVYRCPWHHREGEREAISMPINVTGRAYRGINVPLLWATADHFGYRSSTWATYKQWQECGAQVRKGEKSTMVVFWKKLAVVTGQDENVDDEISDRLMARAYFVFNADQVDGWDASKAQAAVDHLNGLQHQEFAVAA